MLDQNPPHPVCILKAKRDAVVNARAPKTIALGSSHGDYSFDPRLYESAYNLCSTSQDLYYSSLIGQWAIESLPSIDTFVVFYSLFSYGFNLSRSNESYICAHFQEVFGFNEIDYNKHPSIVRPKNTVQCIDYSQIQHFDCGFIRTNDREFFGPSASVVDRALGHLRYSDIRFSGRTLLSDLDRFMCLVRLHGKRAIIVIPPARSDYRSMLPQPDDLFPYISKLCSMRGISFLNTFSHEGFVDADFGDFDHLLPDGEGPHKLATIVNCELGRLSAAPVPHISPSHQAALAEANARTEAVQIVLSAVLASQGWRGFNRAKFRKLIREASYLVPNAGPRSVQHEVLLAETHKVLNAKE